MPVFISVSTAVLLLTIATAVGIQRGLRGEIVIFRSWFDVMVSVCLWCSIAGILFVLARDENRSEAAIPPIVIVTMLAIVWVCLAARGNRCRDLWLVAPTKLTVLILTMLTSAFAIGGVLEVFSPNKRRIQERFAAAVLALAAAAVFFRLRALIKDLIKAAERMPPPLPRRALRDKANPVDGSTHEPWTEGAV